MSVTALMSELATNPAQLAEFRLDPQAVLERADLEERSAAAVLSRHPGRIREAVSLESGIPSEMAVGMTVIVIVL